MASLSHSKRKSQKPLVTWPRIAGVAVVIALLFVAGKHWLTLDTLRSHRDALLQFVSAHYWPTLGLLGLVTIAQTAISLPFSPFLVILAGMLFGLWVGTGLKVLTTAVGSILAVLLVRHLLQDFARRRVKRHPRAEQVLKSFDRHPNSYLLFLRFEPGMPLWLVNIGAGLTDIGLLRFSLLTFVGVIPDTFIFANIGANLAKLKTADDLLSPGIVVALALLAIMALVPTAIAWWRRRKGKS